MEIKDRKPAALMIITTLLIAAISIFLGVASIQTQAQTQIKPEDENDKSLSASYTPLNDSTPALPLIKYTQLHSNSGCLVRLNDYVYHPSRLQLIDPCVTLTGNVTKYKAERDGDSHILIAVDSKYKSILSEGNIKYQNGNLVVEPICQSQAKIPSAAATACNDYKSNGLPIFNLNGITGKHVSVTGQLVIDKEHANWIEIHPLSKINLLSK